MALIPDEIQEKLLCHICNKFLSFQPIKVYPNRKIKCGRCSEDDDSGVVSIFNQLVHQGLFKCVNKFDGCRTLLTYSQVPEHELECVGKSYECPICINSTEVPTYLMIAHFEEKHENNYLDNQCFTINIEEALEVNKFFFYRHQDNLFVIIFKSDASTEYFLLSVMLLGDSKNAENISQKFTLSAAGTDFKIHTSKKPCVAFGMSDIGGFHIAKSDVPKSNNILHINFKIAGVMQIATNVEPVRHEQTDETEKKCNMSRYIFLNDDFKKSHPEFLIGSDFTSLTRKINGISSKISLLCMNCSLLDYCSVSKKGKNMVYFIKNEENYDSLCFPCYQYYMSTLKIFREDNNLMTVEVIKEFLFFCTWKCGKYFTITSLKKHEEVECPLQPIEKCPVKHCKTQNTLFGMCKHLLSDHSPEFSVYCNDRNGIFWNVSLLIDSAPIKQFIIVSNKFILMEFVWNVPQWEIKFSKCNQTKLKAKALIFDGIETFLGELEENQTLKICHMESLKVKCYFNM